MATGTGTGKAIIQDGSALTAVVHLLFKKDATFVLDAATVPVAKMAYKDKLCERKDASPRGRSPENLSRIASAAREIQSGINI